MLQVYPTGRYGTPQTPHQPPAWAGRRRGLYSQDAKEHKLKPPPMTRRGAPAWSILQDATAQPQAHYWTDLIPLNDKKILPSETEIYSGKSCICAIALPYKETY